MNTDPNTDSHKFGKIAIIFGIVCFTLSGLCTGILAVPEYGAPRPEAGIYFMFWDIIIIGAFGFVPAAILILLGWVAKKRGSNIWLTIPIALISFWLALVLFFIIILLTDYL